MTKIMGIDYGDARTGVAISDLLCSIVGSTAVINSHNTEKAIMDIVRLARENNVSQIVVGLPKNMDGSEGPRAQLCREFAEKLREATGLEIVMWDERRTTVEAHNILSQHNYHGKKRKKYSGCCCSIADSGGLPRLSWPVKELPKACDQQKTAK